MYPIVHAEGRWEPPGLERIASKASATVKDIDILVIYKDERWALKMQRGPASQKPLQIIPWAKLDTIGYDLENKFFSLNRYAVRP